MNERPDDRQEYNLIGDAEHVANIVAKFGLKVTDRFSRGDWNVEIPDKISDDVTDECDRLNVAWKMV